MRFEARAFDLGDPTRLDAAIKDVSVVLCVAGPFSTTSRPMADACLRNRVHYLDITDEIDVFEAVAARDAEAKARGGMLLPGGGSLHALSKQAPCATRRGHERIARVDREGAWRPRSLARGDID
jgi:hypothetical protein